MPKFIFSNLLHLLSALLIAKAQQNTSCCILLTTNVSLKAIENIFKFLLIEMLVRFVTCNFFELEQKINIFLHYFYVQFL